MRRAPAEVEHHARGHVAVLEPGEDLVDRREGLQCDVRLDLACRGERQGLGHVVTRADEGAADGDAAGHHVEERHRERARRQPHEHARAAAAGHAQTLRERAQGGRRDEHAVCAAAGGPRDRRGGVADGGRIHDGVGAEARGVRQLAVDTASHFPGRASVTVMPL